MHVKRTPPGRGRHDSGPGDLDALAPPPHRGPRAHRPRRGRRGVGGGRARAGARAAAAVLGPLERLLGPGDDEVSTARAEQTALATRLAAAQREVAALHGTAGILERPRSRPPASSPPGSWGSAPRARAAPSASPSTRGRATVWRSTSPSSRRRASSAGSCRSPRGPATCCCSAAPTSPWACGSVRAVCSARRSGAAVAGGARPAPGLLSFALVERGAATAGDVVTTLGSVGDRPFVAAFRSAR